MIRLKFVGVSVRVVKANVLSPPVACLTTVRLPRFTLVKMQVNSSPAARSMAAGALPSVQMASVRPQPAVGASTSA